jgi:hypothetical protein
MEVLQPHAAAMMTVCHLEPLPRHFYEKLPLLGSRSQSMPQLGGIQEQVSVMNPMESGATSLSQAVSGSFERGMPACKLDLTDLSKKATEAAMTSEDFFAAVRSDDEDCMSFEAFSATWATGWTLSKPISTKTGFGQPSRRRRPASTCSTHSLHRNEAKTRHMPVSSRGEDLWLRNHCRMVLEPLPPAQKKRVDEKLSNTQTTNKTLEVLETMQHRIAKVPEDEFTHDIEHVEAMEIPALASPLPPIPPSPAPTITDWNIGFDDTDGLRDFCTWDVHTEIYSAWGGDGDDWGDGSSFDCHWGDDPSDAMPIFSSGC